MSDTHKIEVSRRGFLKGAGLTAATTVIESASALALEAREAIQGDRSVGPDALPIKLRVNGQEHTVSVEPRYTLAETLRDNLGLTGTKVVCDRGSCSACTIWLDGTPALSCMKLQEAPFVIVLHFAATNDPSSCAVRADHLKVELVRLSGS